jgi:hypothetical protein
MKPILALVLLALTACGGGGGGPTTNPPVICVRTSRPAPNTPGVQCSPAPATARFRQRL